MIEDKDWKLLKSQIDTSIMAKGWNGELFWGAVGLVVGLLPQIIDLNGKALDVWGIIYITFFACGIVGVVVSVINWFYNKKPNKKRKEAIDEFLKDIERRNNISIDKE